MLCDKWQSKTLFLAIFDPRSSIVKTGVQDKIKCLLYFLRSYCFSGRSLCLTFYPKDWISRGSSPRPLVRQDKTRRLDRSTNQLHMHSVCVNETNEDLITLCHLRDVCLLPIRGRFHLWAIRILIYNIVPENFLARRGRSLLWTISLLIYYTTAQYCSRKSSCSACSQPVVCNRQ